MDPYAEIPGSRYKDQVNQGAILRAFSSRDFFLAKTQRRRITVKKGMILYVTQGREDVPLQAAADLKERARSLGVAAVSVAGTEEEAVYGWWNLITRGMQQVLFMTVAYDVVLDRFESRGTPMRLYG